MKGTYTYSRKRKPKNKRGTTELNQITSYQTNELNQYTSIATVPPVPAVPFVPQFDLNGNQTKILTNTGIWEVEYNAKNRPIKFTQGTTVIECKFNFMGARTETKITTNGVTTKHERFINRGYLLIACLDLTRATQNDLYLIFWDPTSPIATRPLAIQKGGTWYTYGHDITKNITETFTNTGQIATTYLYSPFGAVTATGSFNQPIQFSSEFFDSELGLTYYHFRHYNPKCGRWISRDLIAERGGWNEYEFLMNSFGIDKLGLYGGANVAEFGMATWNIGLIDAIRAALASQEAQELTNNSQLPGPHNGQADAYRHCVWNCLMGKSIGVEQAKEVADHHEEANVNNPPREKEMDLHNNEVGRICSREERECSDEDACDDCCKRALKGNKLIIIL